jgi:predicted Rossmann fold nucleotide-binding protein DprA/Smf involved in DNA uptake
LIVQTYDLAHKLRRAGVTVIGGFHTPMERHCLTILLRSPHPVVVCPARSLPRRVASEYRQPLEERRLLLLSPFAEGVNRSDEESARHRNRFVAALAAHIFAAYAAPNSHTEQFCREIVAWGKPLYTLAGESNQNLVSLGAKPVNLNDLSGLEPGVF